MKIFFSLICILWTSLLFAAAEVEGLKKIYDEDGDRIFENLRARIATAKATDEIPVVIQYHEKTPWAGSFAVRLKNFQGKQIRHSYRQIPAVAVSMTPAQIEETSKDPWVEHIELDGRVQAAMDTARTSFGVQQVRKQFRYSGDGDGIKGNYSKNDIVIAVVDSGVNANHQDLRGKVIYWKDFVGGRPDPYDDNEHGTLVSAIALGAGKGKKKFVGVAPQAALVSIKVLDATGSGLISDAIAGIDEVIDKRVQFNIRILNVSLAVIGSSSGRDSLSQAANRAVSEGMVVVVAAGNEGPSTETIGSPAAASKVITVGAGADLGESGFFLASFSSRGPTADGRIKPDLWAPGVRVASASIRGGYINRNNGTSFATPFVAGVVALMLEANPALKPRKIKKILMQTAQDWAPRKKSNEAGSGRLQAYDAITRAAGITEGLEPPDVPQVLFSEQSIQVNETHSFPFSVSKLSNYIAVTAILYDSNGGVSLELRGPGGEVLVPAEQFSSRQEFIVYRPTVVGVYTVRVTGFGAPTSYLLDISADQD